MEELSVVVISHRGVLNYFLIAGGAVILYFVIDPASFSYFQRIVIPVLKKTKARSETNPGGPEISADGNFLIGNDVLTSKNPEYRKLPVHQKIFLFFYKHRFRRFALSAYAAPSKKAPVWRHEWIREQEKLGKPVPAPLLEQEKLLKLTPQQLAAHNVAALEETKNAEKTAPADTKSNFLFASTLLTALPWDGLIELFNLSLGASTISFLALLAVPIGPTLVGTARPGWKDEMAVLPPESLSHTRFAEYLAGLIEGDGWLTAPANARNCKGNLRRPQIGIVGATKEFPWLQQLQETLATGSLYHRNESNAVVLSVGGFADLILVESILNGNMRTAKIVALHRLIDWLNSRFPELKMVKRGADTRPLMEISWMSGFIEADGSFRVEYKTTTAQRATSICCRLSVKQARVTSRGLSTEPFMQTMADVFSTNLHA